MLTMLANMSTPLFWAGLVIAVVAIAVLLNTWNTNKYLDVTSDKWIVGRSTSKAAFLVAIAGVVMVIASYAVDGVNEPHIKTVYKEKRVQVLPKYERLFNVCYENNRPGGSSSYDRMKVTKFCTNEAARQFRILTKGPVRKVVVNKVVYKQLPFKQYMAECAGNPKVVGQEALDAMVRLRTYCADAASTHFRGLVQQAK